MRLISDSEAKKRKSFFTRTKQIFGYQNHGNVVTFKNSPRTRRYLSDFALSVYNDKSFKDIDHYSREGYSNDDENNGKKGDDSSEDFSVDGKSEDMGEGSEGGGDVQSF